MAAPLFKDVPDRTLYKSEIEWANKAGLLDGWRDGSFRPLANISRCAMAAVFYRLSGEPYYVAPSTPSFPDAPVTHQFYKEIEWVRERGLLNGYTDGTFRPENNITRDATAALFYRAAGSPAHAAPFTSPFEDIRTTQQFYKEICWMAEKKAASDGKEVTISTGWADGTFRARSFTSRDAMAAFLFRFDKVV